MRRNMQKIIDNTVIEYRYDITSDELRELLSKIKTENDFFMVLIDIFKYGYALGQRAEKNKGRSC